MSTYYDPKLRSVGMASLRRATYKKCERDRRVLLRCLTNGSMFFTYCAVYILRTLSGHSVEALDIPHSVGVFVDDLLWENSNKATGQGVVLH